MKQIVLKATDKAALWAALDVAGLTMPRPDMDPGIVEPSVLPDISFVEVGTVHAATGNMLTEGGFEFEETAPVDGWFAVMMTDRDVSALSDLIDADPPASVPRFAVPEPTPAEIEAKTRARAEAIKADCAARILAVADERTQGNIAQAGVIYTAMRVNEVPEDIALAQAGFVAGDLTIAAAFQSWRNAMLTHCRALIAETTTDDWPAVPAGVVELAKRF